MMLLGQHDAPEFDMRLWMWLIFAALSVIGGLFGKKKKEPEEAERKKLKQIAKSMTDAEPTTAPPAFDRNQGLVPLVPPAARRVPMVRPAARPAPRPAIARHEQYIDEYEAEPIEAEIVVEPIGPATLVSIESPVEVRQNAYQLEIRRMLGSSTSLRSAFILSELLAPPVGMRHNP